MTLSRSGTALAVAAAIAAFGVAALVFLVVNREGERANVPGSTRVLPAVQPGMSTDRQISVLQTRIRAGVKPAPYADLGSAYLQKVRETGDVGYYTRAAGVLKLAARRNPRDLSAVVGLGTLALARHDFRRGLAYGQQARALAPSADSPFPVVVDALVELGRYDAAGSALQQFVDRKPGLPAYARVSYFRELHGDLTGAIDAMRLAVDAGSATPEGAAYVQTLLGTLEFNRGHVAQARAAYTSALRAKPSFPAAQAGLARTDAADGRSGAAIARLRRVVEVLPFPEYVTALGETELAAGRVRQARNDLALIPVERRLLAANGVNTDVELALFESDHGTPATGVILARRAWASAPSVRAADALGWSLTRAGRPAAGYVWARRALRLGWREPLALYHAGMSASASGHEADARRLLTSLLSLSPRFSPYFAPRARRALARLR